MKGTRNFLIVLGVIILVVFLFILILGIKIAGTLLFWALGAVVIVWIIAWIAYIIGKARGVNRELDARNNNSE